MIAAVNRKLVRGRRGRARRPLIALLRWCAVHAMRQYAGEDVTPEVMAACTRAVERGMRSLADAGALAYFGIADAFELGAAPVRLFVLDDGEPPYGKVVLEVEQMVAWIFAGGARGQGWRRPVSLTISDIAR